MFNMRIHRTVRRTQVEWSFSGGFKNNIGGITHFFFQSFFRNFCQLRMTPTVISDFMTFGNLARENFWVAFCIFTNDKKSCLDVTFFENVQKTRCQCCTRSIIKCHSNIRPVNANRTIRTMSALCF